MKTFSLSVEEDEPDEIVTTTNYNSNHNDEYDDTDDSKPLHQREVDVPISKIFFLFNKQNIPIDF